MRIEVGDLVRIRGRDWLGRPLALVTEVRRLVHDQSGEGYTAVSAVSGGEIFTFSEKDFELIRKGRPNENE
tara:strand:+ start:16940 stop:17152 length:213 start_codon:yes stop_codon:yes gene_type:complete